MQKSRNAKLTKSTDRDDRRLRDPDMIRSTLKRPNALSNPRPHHPLISKRYDGAAIGPYEEIRELRERTLNAEIAKSTLISNLSHEFRTPLNAIIGFSELLLSDAGDKVAPDLQREYIGDIRESGLIMLEMVNTLLESAEGAKGVAPLDKHPTDVVSLISAAAEQTGTEAQFEDIDFKLDADCKQCLIAVDPVQFAKAMELLFCEAAQRAGEGDTILITLRCRPTGLTAAVSRLALDDAASSVRKPITTRSEAPFVAQKPESRKPREVGLGMSVCHAIVEQHGGTLDTAIDAGEGLAALFELPLNDNV